MVAQYFSTPVRYTYMRALLKYILTLFLMLAVSTLSIWAETVTQNQASKIAETFFNAAYGEYVAQPKLAWNGRQLTTDRLFAPFYVYNHPKGGFVIISADTKAYPIIGYSKTSRFDKDHLTENEKELLKKYAGEVEMIRYDSRSPERAIAAWQNLPLYIHRVLENPYDSPEYESLDDEQKEFIESIDRRNNSIMLPAAVEFEIYRPSYLRDYTLDEVLVEDDIPFKFYEDFIQQIKQEEQLRMASLDEIISPSHPVVDILGGAHYSIRFPSDMKLAAIYSLSGNKVMERYYKNTDTINLDISALPSGFYALLALGSDGKVYGIKLYR